MVRKFFKFLWAKAKIMAPDVGVILGGLALGWLLIKIDPLSLLSLEARSQETAAVRSVAPKISTESDDSPKIFYRWPNR
jgi:hypothetical protein